MMVFSGQGLVSKTYESLNECLIFRIINFFYLRFKLESELWYVSIGNATINSDRVAREGQGSLVWKSVQREDAGDYICTWPCSPKDIHCNYNTSTIVSLFCTKYCWSVRANVKKRRKHTILTSVIIEACYSGIHIPNVIWWSEFITIKLSHTYLFGKSAFSSCNNIIFPVTDKLTTFSELCITFDTQHYHLEVQELPTILHSNLSLTVPNGVSITVNCSGRLVPDLQIKWYRNGIRLCNDGHFMILTYSDSSAYYSTLKIFFSTLNDEVQPAFLYTVR